jgi:hypothetical protein
MNLRTVLGVILLAALPLAGSNALAAEPEPAIFRVSTNGPSLDDALKEATQTITRLCAARGYVIVGNRIRPSSDGSFYYGPVTAYCTA